MSDHFSISRFVAEIFVVGGAVAMTVAAWSIDWAVGLALIGVWLTVAGVAIASCRGPNGGVG